MNALMAPPSFGEVGELIRYVLSNPYLFVGSTTVMTTGLLLGAVAMATVGASGRLLPWAAEGPGRAATSALRWLAPKLTLVLAYYGAGSIVLATEILLRFHTRMPAETEIQFRSGIGHLGEALAGIVLLWPLARRCGRAEWIVANFWALAYWTFQVSVLTPPWIFFAGQGELVMGVVKSWLAIGFAVTVYLWGRERERWATPR